METEQISAVMQQLINSLHSPLGEKAATTFLLVLIVSVGRTAILRSMARLDSLDTELRRKAITYSRTIALAALFLGLMLIWGTELKSLAFSLVAVAAAVVIGFKEVIASLLGGLFRSTNDLYSVGDRIEISGFRGDVIDVTLTRTVLYEIGPGPSIHQFTGRSITFPNALLLTQPLMNESSTGPYVLHVFKLPFHRESDWRQERELLLRAASAQCSAFQVHAQEEFNRFARKQGLEAPDATPRVTVSYSDVSTIDLIVRIPSKANRKGRLEQAILEDYDRLRKEASTLL
jgi:small-conductance mechanosensitive channel